MDKLERDGNGKFPMEEVNHVPSEWELVKDIVEREIPKNGGTAEDAHLNQDTIAIPSLAPEGFSKSDLTYAEQNELIGSAISGRIEKIDERVNRMNILETDIEQQLSKVEQKELALSETLNEIEQKKEEISKTHGELEDVKDKADNLADLTSDMAQGQASKSLGKHFSDRQKSLKRSAKFWMTVSFISILGLIITSFAIYRDISVQDAASVVVLSKIALLLPVSVAVWFSVSNYNHGKDLMREYEFKANMALTLMGFREILINDMPDENQDVVGEVVVDTMDKIYSNPMENVNPDKNNQENPLTGIQRPLTDLLNQLTK